MAPTEMTSEELAQQLERLHEESFGWALSCCHWDHSSAEDTLQTAYVRVVSGKARFEGRSAFRTWLFGVIRRVSQEEFRRHRVRGARTAELDSVGEAPMATDDDPVEDLVREESSQKLLEALDQLPDRQREVLHLVFYDDLTIAEAAEVMGVSLGSARTHYDRGKKRMRVLVLEEAVRE